MWLKNRDKYGGEVIGSGDYEEPKNASEMRRGGHEYTKAM